MVSAIVSELSMASSVASTQTVMASSPTRRSPPPAVASPSGATATAATTTRAAEIAEIAATALAEIARDPKWLSRGGVQRALALNPYTPIRITLTLLPLFSTQELHELSRDGAGPM